MMPRKMKVLCGEKMTKEESQARMTMLRSRAKDLDCLRNELRRLKPGDPCNFSEASLRALERIKRRYERFGDD